jgi:hypothetical protein
VRGLDHVVLNVAANAVLRAEKCSEVYVRMFVKDICGMPKSIRQNGRLVAYKADTLTSDNAELFVEEGFYSESDSGGHKLN